MADNKVLQTRIKLKIDTLANWQAIWETFVPLAGEKILFQIPSGDAQTVEGNGITPPQVISKTGDGTTTLKLLPWDSALAADVAAWAKPGDANYINVPNKFTELEGKIPSINHGNLTITDGTGNIVYDPTTAKTVTLTDGDGVSVDVTADGIAIKGVAAGTDLGVVKTGGVATIANGVITKVDADTANKATVAGQVEHDLTLTAKVAGKQVATATYNGSADTTFEFDVTAADLGLTNALHFLGVSTTEIKDEGTQVPTIGGEQIALANLKAGDVVLYGENEFVWTADGDKGAWEELGEASSITTALNTHIQDFNNYKTTEQSWKDTNWKPFSTTDNGYTNKSGDANNMLFGDNTWHGGISRAIEGHEEDATEDYIILDCGSSTANVIY